MMKWNSLGVLFRKFHGKTGACLFLGCTFQTHLRFLVSSSYIILLFFSLSSLCFVYPPRSFSGCSIQLCFSFKNLPLLVIPPFPHGGLV